MLKKLRSIQKHVKILVKSVNFDYRAKLSADFAAYPDTNKIEYALVAMEEGMELFYRNFTSQCKEAELLSSFTMSLLHEIGHLETADQMRDDTKNRKKIDTLEPFSIRMFYYVQLYNEQIATRWACNYIRDNLAFILNWDSRFLKIMQKFIAKNHIEV